MPTLQASITLRSPATRTAVGNALNDRLADTHAMLGMAEAAHWNVRGEHAFLPVHHLLGKLGHCLGKTKHALAGRTRILGVYVTTAPPPNPRLPAYPPDITSPADHLREVTMRLAILLGLLRQTRDFAKERDEEQTAEMLTDCMRHLEKKGRRLLNSMPDADSASAMNAAQASLGVVQNAAGGAAKKKVAPKP